jgi:hypothetical protein
MAGETRIIAFGANGADESSAESGVHAGPVPSDSEGADVAPWDSDDAERPAASRNGYLVPALAAVAIAAWTGFYLWSQQRAFAAASAAEAPSMVMQWAVPVLLVVAVWLLVMRSSTREAARFGDAAALLSRESTNLEARLSAVNGELSLAREFVAAQSRDLEAIGRIAVERLSQNAGRLEALIQENGARLDTIQTVSKSALENMDRLRTQLPVIASAAKDVTNNIANAGRAAHEQLDDLTAGLDRVTAAGAACDTQVASVRESMDGAVSAFMRSCEELEWLASARFDALAERGAEFRKRLAADEEDALASLRSRAAALTEHIEGARTALDTHEAESLTSLRARLTALRDESGVVGRALQDSETRAADAWTARLVTIEEQRAELVARVNDAEHAALDALRERTETLARRSEELRTRLSAEDKALLAGLEERLDRVRVRAGALQAEITAGEQAAITRITSQLASLDNAIAERLAEHERHSDALVWRSEAMVGSLGDHSERMAALAHSGAEVEAALSRSLTMLGDRLTASRTTLAATEGEVERLTDASVRLLELIQASAKHSSGVLPEALAVADDRLSRLGDKVLHLIEDIEAGSRNGAALHGKIDTMREAIAALQGQIEAGQATITERNDRHFLEIGALRSALTEIERNSERIEARTRGELSAAVEQLAATVRGVLATFGEEGSARVHELAERLGEESAQAVDRALRPRIAEASGALEHALAHTAGAGREAAAQMRAQLAEVESAAEQLVARASGAGSETAAQMREQLAELETAVGQLAAQASGAGREAATQVRAQLTQVEEAVAQLVAQASGAGREAAVQVREQLAATAEAVGQLEARIEQARERSQEQVDNDFSRRAALITDSLKSSAIDIVSTLSSDVADTAWAAYLKGDRGIFARRAVSLLDAGETKAVQQLFERDDAFRENVSRYIHDFEALLRQVLSTRDGDALGVTLLSSDMGKLYVALAQGIERLRS